MSNITSVLYFYEIILKKYYPKCKYFNNTDTTHSNFELVYSNVLKIYIFTKIFTLIKREYFSFEK